MSRQQFSGAMRICQTVLLVTSMYAFAQPVNQNLVELLSTKELQVKDLFGHNFDALSQILGDPSSFTDSDGQKFAKAIWNYEDFMIEVDFHPVSKPTINFIWFASTKQLEMSAVLQTLGLEEFNGAPDEIRSGVYRWRNYIAQKTKFERLSWYSEDNSLAIRK